MARIIVYFCAALWLICVAVSLISLGISPEGEGFLRGLNRIEGFLTWQFAAFGIAVAGVIALRLTPPPRSRPLTILGYGPVTLSALLAVAIAAVVAWAAFSPTPPATPADALPPTTAAPET